MHQRQGQTKSISSALALLHQPDTASADSAVELLVSAMPAELAVALNGKITELVS